MQLETVQYFNGLSNGMYLAIAGMMLLFGLSYLSKRYNKRVVLAFVLIAFAFTGFGLFNLFLQQNHIPSFFSPYFIVLSAIVTPLAMAVLVFVYLRAFSMRSYDAHRVIVYFKWFEYLLYAMFIALTCYIPFVGDIYKVAELIIMSFIPAAVALALLSFWSSGRYIFGHVFGVIFSMVAVVCFFAVTSEGALMTANIQYGAYFFFAFISIAFCFFVIRYGHKEIESFFLMRSLDQYQILHDINIAINKNQFFLEYQPQIDLATNKICGAEALIRWQHPKKGLIMPQHFVPLAEQSGMIDTITKWVISQVVADAKHLLDMGKSLKLSLNFSPHNFNDEVVQHLSKKIEKHQLPASYLNIEITENSMMKEGDKTVKKAMQTLEKLGVALSVDDYGTGFSSLSYLQKMSIDELKIDRSFIDKLDYHSDNYAIVFSTLQMSRNLGLCSVAEGVEDEQTLNILKEIGCDVVQGFALAKPMRLKELVQFAH